MILRYLIRRALWGLFTLFIFVTVVFFLVQTLIPGDFTSQLVFQLSPEERQALQHELGLDLPVWERYLRWISDLLRLDLGTSYRSFYYGNLPVARIVIEALPYSLLVLMGGLGVSALLGFYLGKWSGWRGPKFRTHAATFVALAFYSSFPPWIAYLVVIALVPRLRGLVNVYPGSIARWLNASGYSISSFTEQFGRDPARLAAYILLSFVLGAIGLIVLNRVLARSGRLRIRVVVALPILGLGITAVWLIAGLGPPGLALIRYASLPIAAFVLVTFAEFMLTMVVAMSHVRGESYVSLATAKGLPEMIVRDRHAARNALAPLLARLVVSIPYMLMGMVIIEAMFSWPGIGYQLAISIPSDIPGMMGLLITIGIISLLARLSLELAQIALDPQLRDRQLRGTKFEAGLAATQLFDLHVSLGSLLDRNAYDRGLQRLERSLARTNAAWGVFSRNRLALLGLGLLVLFAVMALAQPILLETVWPSGIYDPVTGFDPRVQHPSSPSSRHPLGTVVTGQDILSMFLRSTGHSFTVGLSAGISAAVIGTTLGVATAYFRGRTDAAVSQVSDVFLLLPPPIFMAVAGGFFRQAGPLALGLTYGAIAGLGGVAIVMRSHALTVISKPFVEAARAAGGSASHILIKHVLPHMTAMAFLQMLLSAVVAVIMDGYMSFSGATRYTLSWGSMLAQSELLQEVLGKNTQWFSVLPPVMAYMLFGLAFYLMSRGVLEVADPKLRPA